MNPNILERFDAAPMREPIKPSHWEWKTKHWQKRPSKPKYKKHRVMKLREAQS